MNYEQSLEYIHSLDKFGSRPGLDRVRKLFNRVPNILNQRFIHIAGTNGKGSVSTMLSSILEQAGHRVGLFISPYIVDFRERIQINNRMISKEELAEAVTYFKPILEELNAQGIVITEFEFLTVLSFWIYKQNRCDVVVCEVGMGGLLDSTNLIPYPLCSVITRIDLDHTAFLGDTIEEVAAQKAGIIKTYSTTVTAAQRREAYAVIEQKAREEHNTLYRGEDVRLTITSNSKDGTRFVYRDTDMTLPLIGTHQIDNLRCALATVEVLINEHYFDITPGHIRAGLLNVRHPARFEKLHDDPVVILDGAHNPNGLSAFSEAVRAYYPDGGKTLIIGLLADKDSSSLHLLKGLFTHIIAADIDNPRALPSDELAKSLYGIAPQIEIIPNPRDAFDRALSLGDDIFVCGSLYLASEIRPYILSVFPDASTPDGKNNA